MDGSVDIVMVDDSGEAFGFGKAIGPIEPSGRLNPYKPVPENLLDPERQKRLAALVGGVEPASVEEVSIQQVSVDGNPGSLLMMTIDAGLWRRRFFNVRVDIGDDASIELFFAFDPPSLNDEVLQDIVATVHLDASLIDRALQQERGSSWFGRRRSSTPTACSACSGGSRHEPYSRWPSRCRLCPRRRSTRL